MTLCGSCKDRRFGGTSVLIRATRRNLPEEGILEAYAELTVDVAVVTRCIDREPSNDGSVWAHIRFQGILGLKDLEVFVRRQHADERSRVRSAGDAPTWDSLVVINCTSPAVVWVRPLWRPTCKTVRLFLIPSNTAVRITGPVAASLQCGRNTLSHKCLAQCRLLGCYGVCLFKNRRFVTTYRLHHQPSVDCYC
jgi:hypothetical protein